MATYVPPKRGVAFIFYASLVSQADTKLTQVNPTLAAADFNVSLDGGALAPLATTPTVTPAGGRMVKFSLSAGEMTADNVTVVCADSAGAEWCDATFNIQTAARQIDDLAYPATSGRSMVVDAAGLVDANAVKVGPTGSGTAQTAGDLKASLNTIDDFIDTEVADIQSRLPAALVAGKMDSVADVTAISGDATAADNLESEYDGTGYGHILQRTTIATLASQTSFTLTAGSADNDAYNGCIIVIQDAATAAQKAVGVIGDYTGATKTVTLLNDPAVFTMATTDIVTIIADRALKATVDNRTLDVSTTGEAGLDWANIGAPTTAQNLSGTNIDVDQVVASVSGAVGSVTGLTPATVHSDLDDIQARLPAALVGGRMDSDIGAKTGNVALSAQEKLDVNAEVVDTLNVDTYAEPGQGTPAATTTLVAKIGYLFKNWRNRKTETATQWNLFNDDALTVDQKATVSDAAGTAEKTEIATGP